MNTTQPNFETIKTAFYTGFINSSKATDAIIFLSVKGLDFRSIHTKKKEFETDFNKWLDTIDIRMAGRLIEILKESKKPVPKWAANFTYIIDYNDYGFLDLLRTDNINE